MATRQADRAAVGCGAILQHDQEPAAGGLEGGNRLRRLGARPGLKGGNCSLAAHFLERRDTTGTRQGQQAGEEDRADQSCRDTFRSLQR